MTSISSNKALNHLSRVVFMSWMQSIIGFKFNVYGPLDALLMLMLTAFCVHNEIMGSCVRQIGGLFNARRIYLDVEISTYLQ